MFLPDFLFSPETRAYFEKQNQERTKRRLELCVPWDPNIKWERDLNIKASTYTTLNLFPECPVIDNLDVNHAKNPGIVSPDGKWLYCVKQLPKGGKLSTWYGSRTGSVLFDAPVLIPCLYQKREWDNKWKDNPWMSFTPAEIISMRGGTKRAKGTVVIAGLGLGYQLIEVSKRKQVKKLILVEKEQTLVDWLMPKIRLHLQKEVEVIVGDAYKVLPTLTADVALVDIFDSYGNNDEERDQLRCDCKNIKYVWCWGAAKITGDEW